jgi:phage protein D
MTPAFRIEADGTDIGATIGDRLLAMTLADEEGMKADRVDIEVDDRDSRLELPQHGARLDIALGFRETGLIPMGSWTVDMTSGEGPAQTVRIAGHAADMAATIRAPRSRAWENVTLADIVRSIAADAGLTPVVGDSIADTAWSYLAQRAESDLHLLTRICRPLDATAKPVAGTLTVLRRGEGKNAVGDDIPAAPILRAGLSSWRWTFPDRGAYASVLARWQDLAAGQTRTVVAGDGEPQLELRPTYDSEAEAARAAQAALDRAARGNAQLTLQLAGFAPALFAGGVIETPDLRPGLTGQWYLTRVEHRLDAGGLRTSCDAERQRPEGETT